MAGQGRILRYCAVGGVISAVYVLGYLGLRGLGLSEPLANGLAFGTAVTLQYLGHARVTFARKVRDPRQLLRFVVMIGAGFVVSTLITGPVAALFGLPDWLAALITTCWIPVQNLILMAVWVFAAQDTGTAGTSGRTQVSDIHTAAPHASRKEVTT